MNNENVFSGVILIYLVQILTALSLGSKSLSLSLGSKLPSLSLLLLLLSLSLLSNKADFSFKFLLAYFEPADLPLFL
jgi:hypothetical protein